MTWHGIVGHDRIAEQFRRALARGRLASTFLFVGPSGVGKRAFALKLAQALLCETRPEADLDPCGHCPGCVQVAAGTHPDLERVARPPDKAFIPLDLLIGDDEHRLRAGLCYQISLKPFRGRRKIALIDDADFLNVEGANCLLKTLEEPPPRSLIILLGTSEQRQLPTIRSRCQIVRFAPLPSDALQQLLLDLRLCDDPAAAARAAELGQGSVERALRWSDPALAELRSLLLDQLSRAEFDQLALAKELGQAVDAAGKEAPLRRARLKDALAVAEEFYRGLIAALAGRPLPADADLARAVAAARRWWSQEAEGAAACVEACLDAVGWVESNANQATLIEAFLDDLGQLSRTGQLAAIL